MKKIILTALLALFALVACKNDGVDVSKTAAASIDEVVNYLTTTYSLADKTKVYDNTAIKTVIDGLGDKKTSFLKAITLKKNNTEEKKFKDALKEMNLAETGEGSFEAILNTLKGKTTAIAAKAAQQ
ncbi:hypothetical protein DB313_04705 (plasmid) [Borrelia turcica IST7]|uniref:Uncharacterized protein n=1 Tax=Borrelia turcica IST7 TaxID=1104446 RepID=A0A386PND4_9SPIR|nr:hypothetical protein [Borrelia turcica]AYE36802.1 hypothetical protein DB313_04705 [Borrelia turcica IST7]